jgi:ATP-dependent helicase HepA
MPILQCDRQAAWFAEEDGARLLIASEIGGEGRNFQFAHHLVLVSLPDDPEMLEQRIGRLDRIGQTRDIHIHVPYVEGTGEAGRVRWYHEGLDAFAQPLSGGYELMNVFKDRLDQVDDRLIAETRTFRRDLEARIERGRDRLLELSSFRPKVADEVVQGVRSVDGEPGLAEYLLRLFDYFGVHVEDLDGRDHILVPGHTFHDAFPLRDERLLITYDRERALAREDMTLMSWDHPMVEDGMALILGSERGNSACALAEGIEGFMLQAVFVLECVAPPELEADRFLPATPIVVCVDRALNEVESPAKLSDANIWDLLEQEPSPRRLGPALLTEARKRAEQQVPRLIDEARGAMRGVVGAEYERLRSLLGINDHIRPEEVEQAEHQAMELDAALGRARLRLDAVMLIGNLNSPL